MLNPTKAPQSLRCFYLKPHSKNKFSNLHFVRRFPVCVLVDEVAVYHVLGELKLELYCFPVLLFDRT